MSKLSLWKRLFGYLKPYRLRLFFVLMVAIWSTVFMVFAPYVIGLVTTTLFSSIQTGVFDWQRILGLLGILVGLYWISQFFSFVQGVQMAYITARVMESLRQEIHAKMHRLPLNYYDTHTHGDILSTITNDVDILNNTISQNLTSIVTQVTTAVGVFCMMMAIDPWLSLIPILLVPLSLLSGAKTMKASEIYYDQQQNLLGTLNGYVEEMITGQAIVQTFNYQEEAMKQFDHLNQQLKESSRTAEITAGAINPITTLVNDLGYALCAVLGCFQAIAGTMTVGNVQAMLEYTWRFTDPFATLAGMVASFSAATAAMHRIFTLLDQKEDPIETEIKKPKSHQGRVVFKDVSFGYDEKTMLMNHMNVTIQPGQKVAIVGPTGAGKTTLINLLMRFYEVNDGCIEVDGVNIQEMSYKELRSRFGMVLQDPWLFEGTIEENIGYGLEDPKHEQIVQAAKTSHAHAFIQTLPKGYQTKLNKGAENISQGERQLLTIARAMAKDPEILILDEATSNVDTHTEMLIQKGLDALMKGKTSFVIAHRLSTIRNANLILYMENGNIEEMGTHEELMQIGGKYASLYLSQFE